MNILVVDDNVDSANMLVLLLRALGHSATAVYASASALESARELVPDVIVLDLSMPEMDGYELARRVRTDEALCNVRLIALSGRVQASDYAASRAAGIDHHLPKPIQMEALVNALK